MGKYTSKLNLYKVDPTKDGNDTFNIKTMLNDNWDKVDNKIKSMSDKLDNVEDDANNYTHPANHSAEIITVSDVGNNFSSGNVEDVLGEVGASLSAIAYQQATENNREIQLTVPSFSFIENKYILVEITTDIPEGSALTVKVNSDTAIALKDTDDNALTSLDKGFYTFIARTGIPNFFLQAPKGAKLDEIIGAVEQKGIPVAEPKKIPDVIEAINKLFGSGELVPYYYLKQNTTAAKEFSRELGRGFGAFNPVTKRYYIFHADTNTDPNYYVNESSAKTYHNTSDFPTKARGVTCDSEGNFILVHGDGYDGWVSKYNKDHTLLWSKTFGIVLGGDALATDDDNNIYIYDNVDLVKLNRSDGSEIWRLRSVVGDKYNRYINFDPVYKKLYVKDKDDLTKAMQVDKNGNITKRLTLNLDQGIRRMVVYGDAIYVADKALDQVLEYDLDSNLAWGAKCYVSSFYTMNLVYSPTFHEVCIPQYSSSVIFSTKALNYFTIDTYRTNNIMVGDKYIAKADDDSIEIFHRGIHMVNY
jgi:hypothetical protein